MSGRRMKRLVSETAESVLAFAAKDTNFVPHGTILLLAAFAAFAALAAVPTLRRVEMPPAAANSTLKCYDNVGNHEPCTARASLSLSRFNGQTAETRPPANWIVTALYQQESAAPAAVDQPASGTPNTQAARRVSPPRRRPAPAACGRSLIPCFFSALRRQVTHMASVAARAGARPAREHL